MVWRFWLLVILFTIHSSLFTFSRSIQTINADKAKEVAREQVVWNDRLCTFSTFDLNWVSVVIIS